MGPTLSGEGVTFRVWAPHATQVSVIGSFNSWNGQAHPLQSDEYGIWLAEVKSARVGDHYRYQLVTEKGILKRIDPYSRDVTGSNGDSIVHDPCFNWDDDQFRLPSWNQLVIYELHVGTFNDEDPYRPGQFLSLTARLDHLKQLGINAIQIMPIGQFAGTRSWGYNPSHLFAVDSDYGGSIGLKQFIKRAHQAGIGVILDVVYNHLGPGDLDLWQFDGWSENDRGGIYFYNDDRALTPWGETRPDYGRGEVRKFILDNAKMWLNEYHIDGLRFDSTYYIRNIDEGGSSEIADGWSLLQAINEVVASQPGNQITIAEDLMSNAWVTKDVGAGGAGFGAQWDLNFVRAIRAAVIASKDEDRSLDSIREAILYRYNDDAFERVIYSESHDDVSSGQARVPQEVNPDDPTGWYAQKRSTLAAVMVFTAPGIPMLFQGQEFLEGEWFRDTVPVDWHQQDQFRGIIRMHRDLIRLRLNLTGCSRGLTGQNTQVYHVNEDQKVLAFHRWDQGGASDDVVVIANFSNDSYSSYTLGFPAHGHWRLRFNSDWHGYSELFNGNFSGDIDTAKTNGDTLPFEGTVSVAAYSVLIYSQ